MCIPLSEKGIESPKWKVCLGWPFILNAHLPGGGPIHMRQLSQVKLWLSLLAGVLSAVWLHFADKPENCDE